ncbi:MAG: hypothetical protein Q9P01_16335 [Anaerolineae bacterium]|nr:hypothetical protein [Anaerolineae bacterium]MDQ7036334.1 hypothetical protein [Anaerolineae bacterium]
MNLSSLKLGLAFNLLMKTTPILLVRLGVTLAFWVVALIYLAIVGAVAFMIGKAVDWLGVIIFIVALVSVIPIYKLAYRYVFYMIKAAHIAVMAEMLKDENLQLPAGRGQLEWGKQRVQERFGEVNAMFVVDEIVQGVVRAFTRTVYNVARFLPGDTMRTLISVLNRIIVYATSYIDEAILARSFWEEDSNVWENARDGVVLYAMSWKPLLTAAIALTVLSFVPAVLAFVVFALPVGLLLSLISETLAGWSLIFLLLLSWLIKVAIGDAFAVAAIISTYRRETLGKTPDAEMAAQLDKVSDKFNDLKRRAQEKIKPTEKPESTEASPDSVTES